MLNLYTLKHMHTRCAQADLDGSPGEDGEPLLCRQDADEADDEQLQGDALQGGEQGDLVGHGVGLSVHGSHAV